MHTCGVNTSIVRGAHVTLHVVVYTVVDMCKATIKPVQVFVLSVQTYDLYFRRKGVYMSYNCT